MSAQAQWMETFYDASGSNNPEGFPAAMKLEDLLRQEKAHLINKWFEELINTYPPDTSVFLKRQKDAFANPVGQTSLKGLEQLLDVLLENQDHDMAVSCLDPVIRIRAVQTMFSPSQVVGFVFSLKKIIRAELKKELEDTEILRELHDFELKIDETGLIAFDIFMACREKIYDIKANEERNKIYKAFARAGLVAELPEKSPGLGAF
ncbi:MAG: hypothetical protein DRH32_08985 [Deltaproteobacteria bacterium]|nr:MAG: hypothetical protein DRH32_08985 [Deltaproteobacteria bacterium]